MAMKEQRHRGKKQQPTCLYLVACAVERFVEPVDVSRKVPCGVGHACRRKGVVGERNVGERCRVGVEELAGVLPGHVWLVEPAPQEKPFVLRSKILELVRAAVADALILELVREPLLVLAGVCDDCVSISWLRMTKAFDLDILVRNVHGASEFLPFLVGSVWCAN